MLTWKSGNLKAIGRRGVYTIERARGGEGFVLTGVGHDELPLLELQPFGERFETLDDAKGRAAALERIKTNESEVSGT